MEEKKTWVSYFIISTFVTLYLLVSTISTIHVVEFFSLSNPKWLAISLAIAFEIGAAASLASLIALKKMNKSLVWMLFILLTAMQAMGNTYYAFVNLTDFQAWVELFGLVDEEIIYQKRILSLVSGAVLPIVALGFIKSLVDYIKPEETLLEQKEDKPKLDGGSSSDSNSFEKENLNEPLITNLENSVLLVDSESPPYVNENTLNIHTSPDDTYTIGAANLNKDVEKRRYVPNVVEMPTSIDSNPTRLL